MNVHRPVRRFASSLTSKGQVTIPKAIRDALGLSAGDLVAFSLDEDGNARIEPADNALSYEHRKAQVLKGVAEARRVFKAAGGLPDGMTNEEWYELMRGPPAEV